MYLFGLGHATVNRPFHTKVEALKDGDAISIGGRYGLYVRGWLSGRKAFHFRAGMWIKIGDYPDTSLATANDLALVAKRLMKEGYGKDALVRGFALGKTA